MHDRGTFINTFKSWKSFCDRFEIWFGNILKNNKTIISKVHKIIYLQMNCNITLYTMWSLDVGRCCSSTWDYGLWTLSGLPVPGPWLNKEHSTSRTVTNSKENWLKKIFLNSSKVTEALYCSSLVFNNCWTTTGCSRLKYPHWFITFLFFLHRTLVHLGLALMLLLCLTSH